jgi:MFS family permease
MAQADDRPGSAAAPKSSAYLAYVLVLLLAANTLSYADRHLFSILIPAIKADFEIGDALLGFIGGPAFMLSYVLLSVPLAALADRWSRRKVLAISAAVWSAATAMCGWSANAVQLLLARVVVGVGEAGGFPPSQSMIVSLFPPHRRSSALGVLSAGTYIGIVIGLTGGGFLAQAVGWRNTFLILAAPGVLVALLVWLTGPRRAAGANIGAGRTGPTMWQALRRCWSLPAFRLLSVGMGLYNVFGYAGAIWLPSYLMRSHGMTVVEAGLWLGVGAAIGGVLGALSSGVIVDRLTRYDQRWQLRTPAVAMFVSLPLLVAMFLLPSGASMTVGSWTFPVVALLAVLSSYCASIWQAPSFAATATMVAPELRSQAGALLVVVVNVMGSVIGPLVAGAVSEQLTPRLGDEALRYSLLLMTVMILAGGTLFWRAGHHYRIAVSG